MALESRDAVLGQLNEALKAVNAGEVGQLEALVSVAREVFCHGFGRSGLGIRAFAMRLMHMGIPVSIVGDTLAHPICAGDVLVLASASGGSDVLLSAARKAREAGAKIALICGNEASPLAEWADVMVVIHAPSKEDRGDVRASVLPMGSLFEEASFILLDMVILDLMRKLHVTNEDMVSRHANLE